MAKGSGGTRNRGPKSTAERNKWVGDNLSKIDNAEHMPDWFMKNPLKYCDRVPNGFVFVHDGKKYMIDKTNNQVTEYGNEAEVAKQVKAWRKKSDAINEIMSEFEGGASSLLKEYPDSAFTGINLKQRGSALRKADSFYKGDFEPIEDLVRCNFVCKSQDYARMSAAIAKKYNLYKNQDTQEYVREHYGAGAKENYVCRFMNVAFKNGVKGEIMLTPYEMFAGREKNQSYVRKVVGDKAYKRMVASAKAHGIELGKGHEYYERRRLLDGRLRKAIASGDTASADKLRKEIGSVSQQMNDYYESLSKYCNPYS